MSVKESTVVREHSRASVAVRLPAAIALSMLGLITHNVREFGFMALFDIASGTIPMVIFGAALVVVWWCVSQLRKVSAAAMIVYGLINFVIGGIITVLPLGFLPFEPEQSLPHYLSHVIYSVTQLPLIYLGARQLFVRSSNHD